MGADHDVTTRKIGTSKNFTNRASPDVQSTHFIILWMSLKVCGWQLPTLLEELFKFDQGPFWSWCHRQLSTLLFIFPQCYAMTTIFLFCVPIEIANMHFEDCQFSNILGIVVVNFYHTYGCLSLIGKPQSARLL